MNNIKKEANLKIKKEIIKTIGCIMRYKNGIIWSTKYREIKGQ
jgi:hypothetical protein